MALVEITYSQSQLGDESLPTEAPEAEVASEEFLRALHRVLLEVSGIKGRVGGQLRS